MVSKRMEEEPWAIMRLRGTYRYASRLARQGHVCRNDPNPALHRRRGTPTPPSAALITVFSPKTQNAQAVRDEVTLRMNPQRASGETAATQSAPSRSPRSNADTARIPTSVDASRPRRHLTQHAPCSDSLPFTRGDADIALSRQSDVLPRRDRASLLESGIS